MSNAFPPPCRRSWKTRSRKAMLPACAALGVFFHAQAVVLFGPDGADPNVNTTAPGGALSGSGWDMAGDFHGFLAYPVDPHHFIAARHIGGGPTFTFDGTAYSVIESQVYPGATDLAIFTVSGSFPRWVTLYSGADETGKDFVLFGNGYARGAEIVVNSPPVSDTPLRGWEWGTTDGRTRWGQNTVSDAGTNAAFGELLVAEFNRGGLPFEATVSAGDSSGGWFIHDSDGIWKLAGLSLGADAHFRYGPTPNPSPFPSSGTGDYFLAAIFDAGGLYDPIGASNIVDRIDDIPASFAASRISASLPWINSAVPEPAPWHALFVLPFAAAAAALRSARRRLSLPGPPPEMPPQSSRSPCHRIR